MYVVVGHHCRDDQSIAVEVVDKAYITFPESDVIGLPLELLYWPFVHTMNISEQSLLHLLDVAFLRLVHFSSKVGSAEDRLDFVSWFYFRSVVLRPSPHIVDVILEVPAADEFLDLILEGDALLNYMTDIFVKPTVFVLVPLGAVST